MENNGLTNPYGIINNALGQASSDYATHRNVFDDLFMPGLSQQIEFGQQVALQQMQNDWSVEGKMAAGMDVGINPHTMAAGIAGAGTPSTGAPNSAVGAGAQGVGAASQAVQTLGAGLDSAVNAYEKFSLTGTKKEEMKSNIRNLLSTALHNDWLAYSISEMLPLQKQNERADTFLKLANFSKAREEKKLINKRISEAEAHISELNAQASLFEKQGNLVDSEKLRVEAQTLQIGLENDRLQWDKNFREKWHFDNTKPVDNALIEAMMFQDGDANGVVNTIGRAVNEVGFQEELGRGQAEGANAYDIAYNTSQGGLAAAIKKMETDTEFQKELLKAGVKAEETKHVADIILKYLFGLGFSINVGKVGVTNQNP